MPAKVGIKSSRFAIECFIYTCMDVTTQLELCLHERNNIIIKIMLYNWAYQLRILEASVGVVAEL